MIPSSIERDIVVDAPVDVVWRAVTQPDEISDWFSDSAELDPRAGGEGTLTWTDRATSRPTTVRVTVDRIEPPRTFRFRWIHPEGEEARDGNSLLVEFTLTPEQDRTRVAVLVTGLPELEWPEEQKASLAEEQRAGWEIHLASLRSYVSGRRGDA